MRAELVTSFSVEGAELYGHRCVASVQAHWSHPLVAYTDAPMACTGADVRLTSDIPEWVQTKVRLPHMRPDAPFKPTNYVWDARRFAVKVFVWHDAAVRLGHGLLVWLDGDTVTTADVPASLPLALVGESSVAYLGRGEMHPETGIVVFRLPEALPLLRWCREFYATGAFHALQDGWTDCHVLRAGLEATGLYARDLTSHLHDEWRSSVDAVALSPWGRYVQHLKGPARKRTRKQVAA